jgi:hypothetical protein
MPKQKLKAGLLSTLFVVVLPEVEPGWEKDYINEVLSLAKTMEVKFTVSGQLLAVQNQLISIQWS